jgi:hypothetical protein
MNRGWLFAGWVFFLSCGGFLFADEPYIHTFTGFTFPPNVEAFARVRVTPYNADRSDIEVDYDNVPYTVHLSAYVYPVREFYANPAQVKLQQHYDDCKASVKQAHPDAKLIEEEPVVFHRSNVDYHGYRALYTFRDKFVGHVEQDLFSQLLVFRRDDYFVMFRISYVQSDKKKAEAGISDFLDVFAWPPGGNDASGGP